MTSVAETPKNPCNFGKPLYAYKKYEKDVEGVILSGDVCCMMSR